MSKGLKDFKELKTRINLAIIQLGDELSTLVNCSSNMNDEFKTALKNDYKRRLTALNNAVNELGRKELKDKEKSDKELDIIKQSVSFNYLGDLVLTQYGKVHYDLLKETLEK